MEASQARLVLLNCPHAAGEPGGADRSSLRDFYLVHRNGIRRLLLCLWVPLVKRDNRRICGPIGRLRLLSRQQRALGFIVRASFLAELREIMS